MGKFTEINKLWRCFRPHVLTEKTKSECDYKFSSLKNWNCRFVIIPDAAYFQNGDVLEIGEDRFSVDNMFQISNQASDGNLVIYLKKERYVFLATMLTVNINELARYFNHFPMKTDHVSEVLLYRLWSRTVSRWWVPQRTTWRWFHVQGVDFAGRSLGLCLRKYHWPVATNTRNILAIEVCDVILFITNVFRHWLFGYGRHSLRSIISHDKKCLLVTVIGMAGKLELKQNFEAPGRLWWKERFLNILSPVLLWRVRTL